jgi:phospholipase C
MPISRRDLLRGGVAAGGAAVFAGAVQGSSADAASGAHYRWATPVARRQPDSLPFPDLPAGTDTMPEIEHIVVLMMENHSYDNYLGMLGRGTGEKPRGDGFTIGSNGMPTNSNPNGNDELQMAFPMPLTCQQDGRPSQEWKASHEQYHSGTNQGFVTSPSGPVAMGYWDGTDLPFYYSLASTFPLNDRWFCCLLGQTDPNRRYLLAATSAGLVDDFSSASSEQLSLLTTVPPNGTIFDRLQHYGISWRDYYHTDSDPSTLVWLEDPTIKAESKTHVVAVENFFDHAAHGDLPGFCIIDPNFDTGSEEDPQDISIGETFAHRVIDALMKSPAWDKSLLVWNYDEHGGYYDHVPPPPALAPDSIKPVPLSGESHYDGFHRYGFRVPAVVVSPFARKHHVTHTIHDHTSILAMVERKWNLPALTYRDANANDLTDFLDLSKGGLKNPAFKEPPALAEPLPSPQACTPGDAGTIPPPGSVVPA